MCESPGYMYAWRGRRWHEQACNKQTYLSCPLLFLRSQILLAFSLIYSSSTPIANTELGILQNICYNNSVNCIRKDCHPQTRQKNVVGSFGNSGDLPGMICYFDLGLTQLLAPVVTSRHVTQHTSSIGSEFRLNQLIPTLLSYLQ